MTNKEYGMKIFLKLLVGIIAVLISLSVGMVTLLMLMFMGASVANFNPWLAYAILVSVCLVPFGIIFSVCHVAKKIIVKLNS